MTREFIALLLLLFMVDGSHMLSEDFYDQTCPLLELILWNVTQQKVQETPTAAGATVRLFFHDCFTEGCDGSILISSTSDNTAERDAKVNQDLAGDAFDAVARAKTAAEAVCPGVVSCADILAIIARNFVVWRGGPMFTVLKGRRDGRVSMASRVGNTIPDATFSIQQLIQQFQENGLDLNDLVALSGAHTLGFAHCVQFQDRLYNYNAQNATDPSLSPDFASSLKQACPRAGVNPDLVEPFDPSTPFLFDNLYYQALQNNMGLLQTDKALLETQETSQIVNAFAGSSEAFFQSFATAMQKLGNIGVKTGSDGEIRNDCTRFN